MWLPAYAGASVLLIEVQKNGIISGGEMHGYVCSLNCSTNFILKKLFYPLATSAGTEEDAQEESQTEQDQYSG